MKSELVKKFEELSLEENVEVLDAVSEYRLIQEFDEARIFLYSCVVASSGDRDGIPVVLMEEMVMKGVPISTTVSGIPELIEDGETGFLVKSRNVEAICEKLVRVLSLADNELGRIMEKSRAKIESDFNAEREFIRLERTLEIAQEVFSK